MLEIIKWSGLTVLSLITWKMCYDKYETCRKKYEEMLLFKRRHDCVVIYTKTKGMSGWAPHVNRLQLNIKRENCLNDFYEPVTYFIETATKTLDVSFMLISVKAVYEAVLAASRRSVKVRLRLDFGHNKKSSGTLRRLIKEGVQIQMYISDRDSIMHQKYMLKDYDEGCSCGFVCYGSMNLTESAFVDNYENFVFSSDFLLVKQFKQNFDDCWNYLEIINQSTKNESLLMDVL